MSEAIEESGSNVLMLAAALGTGRARWRFESDPGTDEPEDMGQLKPDNRTTDLLRVRHNRYFYYSFTLSPGAIVRRVECMHFAPDVWMTHHPAASFSTRKVAGNAFLTLRAVTER